MTSAEEQAVAEMERITEIIDHAIEHLQKKDCKRAMYSIFNYGQALGEEGRADSWDVAWGDLAEYDRMRQKARAMWDLVDKCKC